MAGFGFSSFFRTIFGSDSRTVGPASSGDSAGPETPSWSWREMQPEWRLLEDVIAGPEAVRRAGEHYLLRFEAESHREYHRRLHCAPWRPEFVDALRNLTSRPFSREPALNTDAPAEIQQFVTNVDACGNSLGVFARGFFHRAVAFGLGGIMSDFPIVPNTINGQPLTIYDLNQINPRPYWWEVRA